MHALILLPYCDVPRKGWERHHTQLMIAVDGAVSEATSYGSPSIICGDFDSITMPIAHSIFPESELVELPDQNLSDLEKSILLSRERGATEITVRGALTGRVDHSISILSTLVAYHREFPICFEEKDSSVWVHSPHSSTGETRIIKTFPGDLVSLLPLSEMSQVSVSDVQWPLSNSTLRAGTGGVSNRANGDTVTVTVHAGIVAITLLPL